MWWDGDRVKGHDPVDGGLLLGIITGGHQHGVGCRQLAVFDYYAADVPGAAARRPCSRTPPRGRRFGVKGGSFVFPRVRADFARGTTDRRPQIRCISLLQWLRAARLERLDLDIDSSCEVTSTKS